MNEQAIFDAIKAKADQLNSDDLIGKDLDITITRITCAESGEQRVSIYFAEGEGAKKPWKPCKGMLRVMVDAWTGDLSKWKGQRVRLFRDETVKWAGAAVGGIRIRAMSGISANRTFAVTQSKGSKVQMKVARLEAPTTKATPPADKPKPAPEQQQQQQEPETPFDDDAPAEPKKPTTLAEALKQMPLTGATAMGSFCSSLEGGPIDIVALRMAVKAFVLSKKDDKTSPIDRLAENERAPAKKALKEGAAANVGWCAHLVGLWLT
jgi:hypothetical protein